MKTLQLLSQLWRCLIFNKGPVSAFYIVEVVELVPTLHQLKGSRNKSPECRSVCVYTHHGTSEGPTEWFLGRVCKFQNWLLSISEALLSHSCPRCPASQRRCSETQHTKWDVTCVAILFYLYWMGRCCGERCKKALTCCLMRSGSSPTPRRRLCNFHSRMEGRPHPHSNTTPHSQRQRKTVDNYLVKFPGSQCVGVTKLIFDCGLEDMQWGHCVDACVGGALSRVKEQF